MCADDAFHSLYRGRGGPKLIPSVNKQDGFSTSGTILFYLEGLKEAHEHNVSRKNNKRSSKKLIGPDEIALSTTNKSLTLLLDLESHSLVPHFAEIDYMDSDRPLVFLQSAKSLARNRRYAVILVDAEDKNGILLPPSEYLIRLIKRNHEEELNAKERKRGLFYRNTVIPELYKAATWLGEDSRIQMLFDFHTTSEMGQLGTVRKIVEGSLNVVSDERWGGWGHHNVRVLQVDEDKQCQASSKAIGKIIHAEIDLPTFLTAGRWNGRAKMIDTKALQEGYSTNSAPVKCLLIVPCAIAQGKVPVKAVIDYGHGFMNSRQELFDMGSLHQHANEEGYIMMATDWRGMSRLDLMVVQKTFLADPSLLDSIQANVMQGFGFKASIQHFVETKLLAKEFLNLEARKDKKVRYVFWGISQGGILGSAYSTLMSRTNYLDGAVITSAAAPLSLIVSRSTVFAAYQTLLIRNIHNNRQIRIFLQFFQMAFDCVHGPSVGLTGKSTSDHRPFKTLLATGIGDPVVTTIGMGKFEVLFRYLRPYSYHLKAHNFCFLCKFLVFQNTWREIIMLSHSLAIQSKYMGLRRLTALMASHRRMWSSLIFYTRQKRGAFPLLMLELRRNLIGFTHALGTIKLCRNKSLPSLTMM